MTQVVASFAAKAAPGAPLAAVAAIFVASALVVVAVGLTYYVLVERRFMTRDWHLLVWAAIKAALGVRSSAAAAEASRTGDFAVGDGRGSTPEPSRTPRRAQRRTALIARSRGPRQRFAPAAFSGARSRRAAAAKP